MRESSMLNGMCYVTYLCNPSRLYARAGFYFRELTIIWAHACFLCGDGKDTACQCQYNVLQRYLTKFRNLRGECAVIATNRDKCNTPQRTSPSPSDTKLSIVGNVIVPKAALPRDNERTGTG